MVITNNFQDNHGGQESNIKNLSESEYVMIFKDIADSKLYPSDFDTWTVKQQYDWTKQNLTQIFPNVPKSLENFLFAYTCPLHFRSLEELPEWIDMDKYRRAQKFAHENYFALIIFKIIGLIYGFTFENTMKSFFISGHRQMLFTAFKKYVGLVINLMSWFTGEPWSEGTRAYRSMQVANKLHSAMRTKLCKMDNKEIDAAAELKNPWCPDHDVFQKDFAAICPFEKPGQRFYSMFGNSAYRPKDINNADISVMQALFITFILHPQNVGIHNVTDEDLESFCHMWRCHGYFLGLEDEYNFCRGSLREIKERLRDLLQYWIVPNFKDCSYRWEHLTKCFGESIGFFPLIPFLPTNSLVLFATDELNLNMPNLYASLSYKEWFLHHFYKFLLRHAMKYTFVRKIINKLAHKVINDASNYSPEKLAEIEEKAKKMQNISTTC